jgi:peptide/nickel transport system substrate-binding protein
MTVTTRRRDVLALAALGMAAGAVRPARAAAPSGQLTVGVHITLAPTWLDPAETQGIITPFMVLYALHDGVAKPMPQGNPSPSLAESWSAGEDGLSYEFVLRKDAKFHNGEPVTADDVKFSFERYRGAAHALLKERVASVEAPDPQRVVFKLKNPWPDFITPGIELVLEAFDGYWRKMPSVKRIVLRVIPDESTRLAALKNGEVDIAYSIRAELAEELQRTPGLTLRPTVGSAPYYLYFPEQWDAKSPWHDRRVRQAAKFALDYNTINKALTLGYSHITGSLIPENFEFYEKLAPPVYDPEKARQLLAEAGFSGGFDAGFYTCDVAYANLGEAALNYLAEVGIRAKLRPLERAAFFKGYADKKYKNIIQGASGAFGNAATRLEEFVVKGGNYAYGSYPEIDELFPLQAVELDHAKRAELLAKMQHLLDDRTMYVPIWQLAFISGVGPRVAESGFGLIKGFVYTAPYEDITLKSA